MYNWYTSHMYSIGIPIIIQFIHIPFPIVGESPGPGTQPRADFRSISAVMYI